MQKRVEDRKAVLYMRSPGPRLPRRNQHLYTERINESTASNRSVIFIKKWSRLGRVDTHTTLASSYACLLVISPSREAGFRSLTEPTGRRAMIGGGVMGLFLHPTVWVHYYTLFFHNKGMVLSDSVKKKGVAFFFFAFMTWQLKQGRGFFQPMSCP